MKTLEGIYLVIDPKMGLEALRPKLADIVRAGVGAIQVWDHWNAGQDKAAYVTEIKKMAPGIPILINNDRELAHATGVAGVHFDRLEDLPQNSGGLIVGLTLNGRANWQELNTKGVDYISFCSMFPSSSTDVCELVDFAIVKEACKYFPGSVFAAGGINLQNVHQITDLGVSGVALISGLLKSENPFQTTSAFQQKLIRK